MTPRQAVASAAAPPRWPRRPGPRSASRRPSWPRGGCRSAPRSYAEPHPGVRCRLADPRPGWVLAPALVAAGSAAAAALALTARRRQAVPRRSSVAAAAAAAGLPYPWWWAPGSRSSPDGAGRRCRSGPPCWARSPACWACWPPSPSRPGSSDAAANPARFGQTWQLTALLGLSGQDFGPGRPGTAGRCRRPRRHRGRRRADRRSPVRPGLDRELTYDPVAGKGVPVVLTDGRMPVTRRRDRARPDHRQRTARGHGLGDPAHRRHGAAGRSR